MSGPCATSTRSTSSAAGSPGPRRPGRPPRWASPWCCTRCGPSSAPSPTRPTALAELVCSNSFRSDDDEQNAVGLLHWEMRQAGGLIIATADRHGLPAGSALAIDREPFSAEVTARLEAHPLVTIDRAEVAGLPPADWSSVIVATGPLTSPALAAAIRELTDELALAFFDAIAPIVHFDSVDLSKAWFQSRYDKGETRGRAHRLPELPDGPRRVRGLRRRAPRRRDDRVQGLGGDALLRGLPADRGDGRARPRDAALRSAEAGRPHQPARARA